jgi:alpha-amylase
MRAFVLLLALTSVVVAGKSPSAWRGKSIYQILTDRFASPAGVSGSKLRGGCGYLGDYCGGTYRAAIPHLDYIKFPQCLLMLTRQGHGL